MAKHRYLTGALFDDDDDSDVEEDSSPPFRSRIPKIVPKETRMSEVTDLERDKQITLQKIQEIEQSTLASAVRSINMLKETQDIGLKASEELVIHGERLQNTNTKLEEIDANLKESQKHINGIKSVFYGIKKYIAGKSRSPSPLRRKISPHKQSPLFGRSTFYDSKDGSSTKSKSKKKSGSESPVKSLHSLDVQLSPGPSSPQVDEILEASLQEMTYHLGQLKGLGVEFGKEIDHQNELIDILQDKVERADMKIGKQNKDMNNILGK